MRLNLFDCLHVDERADHRTPLEAVGDLHRAGRLREVLRKGIVDAVLHQKSIGAHAGLAGIAVFGRDRALHHYLDIGVVEDDEWRVAAQFQRELFDGAGALLHQQFADFGRAGEGQFADGWIRGQFTLISLVGPAPRP